MRSLWFNTINHGVLEICSFLNSTTRISKTSAKFLLIEKNANGYFLNTLQFFLSNFILLILSFLVGNIFFRIFFYFKFKISYIFKSFNFFLALPLSCLEGNVQYMAYLMGFEMKNLYDINFSHKIHSFFIVAWLFLFFFMIVTIYFGFKYFYKRKASRFYENCKSDCHGVLYFVFSMGIRNFLLGFCHFFISEDLLTIYMKPVFFIIFECIFLAYSLWYLRKRNFFISKFSQWIRTLTTFLRIILNFVLSMDLSVASK